MKRIFAIAAALALGSSAFAQELSIERFAPEQTLFIAGVKNCQQTFERWNNTTLPKLMELEAVKKSEEDAMEDAPVPDKYEKLIEEIFEEMGIEEDPSKITPQGPMGLAVYLHMDDATGERSPAVFVFADFGDNAERVQSVMDRLLAEADEDDQVNYEIEDVMGRKVYSFDRPEMNGEQVDEALDEFDPGMDFGPLPVPGVGEFFEGMDKVHFSRDGNVFFASSQMQQLTDVFELIDNKGGTSFADSDSYLGTRALLGESDAYGMLFIQPMFQLLTEQDPQAAFVQGMITSFVGDIKSIGLSMKLDGSDSMIEGAFGMYMPNGKSGITMLLDRPSGRAELPPFVGPNAVNFSSMNIDMGGLGKLLQQLMTAIPMFQGPGADMAEMQRIMDAITATLGDRIYTTQTLERPLTIENMGSLTAIACKDTQAFETAVSELLGQMQFQPRDFLGQRIYGMDPEMADMMGMPGGGYGVGIGGGYVFIGPQNAIELALRTTLQSGAPTLAGENAYRRAVNSLASDGLVAWGYMDIGQSAEAQVTASRIQRQKMIEQMKEWNPEFAADMEAEPDSTRHWDEESFRQLRELIGPMAWQMRSTDHGFVTNVFLHRGEEAAEAAE